MITLCLSFSRIHWKRDIYSIQGTSLFSHILCNQKKPFFLPPLRCQKPSCSKRLLPFRCRRFLSSLLNTNIKYAFVHYIVDHCKRPFHDLAPLPFFVHTLVPFSPIDSVIETINEMSNILTHARDLVRDKHKNKPLNQTGCLKMRIVSTCNMSNKE